MTLFPVVLILFALGMERFEARLSKLTVPEQEVQKFLDGGPNKEEVAALADKGMSDALDRFNRRMGRKDDLYPSDHNEPRTITRRAS